MPNGGVLRVEPGLYTIDWLDPGGDAVRLGVRTYPDTITRLEPVSPR